MMYYIVTLLAVTRAHPVVKRHQNAHFKWAGVSPCKFYYNKKLISKNVQSLSSWARKHFRDYLSPLHYQKGAENFSDLLRVSQIHEMGLLCIHNQYPGLSSVFPLAQCLWYMVGAQFWKLTFRGDCILNHLLEQPHPMCLGTCSLNLP